MTSRQSKLITYLPFLGIVLFHVLVIYRQFITPGEILRMSDFIFPNVNNRTNLNLSFYVWTTYGLGQPSIPSLSMGLVYLLSRAFGTPFAQQCFGFAPLLVASIAMYVFLTRAKWIESRFWAALIAILYVVNWPVFSYEGDNAALLTVTGLMWTFAVIPLVMFYAHKIFIEEDFSIRNGIWLALWTFVASFTNSQAVVIIGGILAPFIIYYVCEGIIWSPADKKEAVVRLLLCLIGWFTICFLLVLPVNMPLLNSIFFTGNVQSLYGVKATLWPHPDVYRPVYPIAISPLLLLSSPRPHKILEFLGFSVPILLILGVLYEKSREKKLMALILFALVLLAAGWIQTVIMAPVIVEHVYAIPVLGQLLQVIRNPLKLFMFLAPALAILLALGIENTAKRLRSLNFASGQKRPVLAAVGCTLLIVCAVVSIFLNHDGRIFQLRDVYLDIPTTMSGQGGEHALPFGRLNRVLLKITQELQSRGSGRILWVPNENEIWVQTTQISYENVLSYPSSLTMGLYQKEIAESFTTGTPSILARILAILRIRFVVVIKYAKQQGPPRIWGTPPWGEHIVGDPTAFMSFLETPSGFVKVREDDSYAIYENAFFR